MPEELSPELPELPVVRLKVPIRNGADWISELRFLRRAEFGDLEAAEDAKGSMGRVVVLVSRLCNLTLREARSIDAVDVENVANAVAEILGEGGEDDEEGGSDEAREGGEQ